MLMAAWPRPSNNAALASLKKFPSDFSNHVFDMTKPKEAFYAGTGVTAYRCKLSNSGVRIAYQHKEKISY